MGSTLWLPLLDQSIAHPAEARRRRVVGFVSSSSLGDTGCAWRNDALTLQHPAGATCIFCDNPPDSGEHLWSDWMGSLLQRPGHKARKEIVKYFPYEGAPFGEIVHRRNHGATHKRKIHVVCARCNNGWMSQLESAKKYLKPMLVGDALTLDASALLIVTEWVVLKILVLENEPLGDRPATPIFSREQRLAFRDRREIPRGFRIWLAGSGSPKWYDSLSISAGRLLLSSKSGEYVPSPGPGHNAQSVTWGIRSLLIHSFAVTYPYLESRLQWDGPPYAERLWPPTGRSLNWPPRGFLTAHHCDSIAGEFLRLASSLPRSR